jgi:hypothetical protein
MIYELQPFNQARFDACMAWVAKEFDRSFSQYEAVKIHALADALHTVRYHNPIVGGRLRKLRHGPVDLDALNRSKDWSDDDKSSPMSPVAKRGKCIYFARKPGPTHEDMFTPSELDAIRDAARIVFSMTFAESQKFFHGDQDGSNTFLGKAWKATKSDKAPISWEDIVTAYSKETKHDAAQLRALICL